jgi:hypothetical protein
LRNERESVVCEIYEGAERSACNAALEKRRRSIAMLLLRSKLTNPTGFFSFISIAALFVWAAITGAFKGAVANVKRRLAPPTRDDTSPPLATA